MGRKIYTTIVRRYLDPDEDKRETVFEIPLDATPQQIANITGMPLERAVEFYKNRTVENDPDCPTIYCSPRISEIVSRDCRPGTSPVPESVLYVIDECYFISYTSYEEAEDLARAHLQRTKQEYANANSRCEPLPVITYCSDPISETVFKDCRSGTEPTPASVTFSYAACKVQSTFSKEDANIRARLQFDSEKTIYANTNIVCEPIPLLCNTEITGEAIKSNCPQGSVGLPVPYTVQANQFCNVNQAVAQQQAQDLFNASVQLNADGSSTSVYCQSLGQQCNDEQTQQISYTCPDGTLVTDTLSVAAGQYCVQVTTVGGEATAKTQANDQASAQLSLLVSSTDTSYLSTQCPEPLPASCTQATSSGGPGVTDIQEELFPGGGYLILDFYAQGQVDKLEIIFNGIKRTTSSMTNNNGSTDFENSTDGGVAPSVGVQAAAHQYIGTDKCVPAGDGCIPSRQSELNTGLLFDGYSSITIYPSGGSSGLGSTGTRQFVWFKYTAADYIISQTATVRVSGSAGTAWNYDRRCDYV